MDCVDGMRNGAFRWLLGVLAALILPMASWGQNAGFITLYGLVRDSGTSKPLSYASVNLSGTNVSNVSNQDGCFSLKIPQDTPEDTDVLISHLGYLTGVVKVSDFGGHTSERPLMISLMETSIMLDPVTVSAQDPYELVQKAFSRVAVNYPLQRLGMTAFYREMIRKGTAKYLVINEAVVDIDKSSYLSSAEDRLGIYKGRGLNNYVTSDTLFVKLQGGISTSLEVDLVKNPFLGVSLDEMTAAYRFFMDGMATYDGYTFYKVGFCPSDDVKEILFKGHLYIETERLAIGRVEAEMDLKGREEEAARYFIVKAPVGTRFSANTAKYVVSYKCFDGKWYYDYFRADMGFTTKKRHSLLRKNFTVTEEMAVTDHGEGRIAIEPSSRVRFKDILSDQVADFLDEQFWEDYNIIEPDESIEAIIRKLVRKLNTRK